jgi:hypothetical protein
MKILCLLSKGKGHLDFGGMGFLQIAKNLKNQGHEVIFFTVKSQFPQLIDVGFSCEEVQNIDWLWLYRDDYDYQSEPKNRFIGLKFIELKIQKYQPNVVLVDRLLGLAGHMLNHLKIPYVSIGTPGGNWKKEGNSIIEGESKHNHNGNKELLRKRLHWEIDTLSAWCNSPYLNIVFVGQEYYPNHNYKHTLFVNHFDYQFGINKNEIGISLGSGTFDYLKMLKAIFDIDKKLKANQKIRLYGNKKVTNKFIIHVPKKYLNKIEIKGFVDFKTEMQELKTLVFSGGIGTLWQCLNNGVKPLIISAKIHDQNYNKTQSVQLELNEKTRNPSDLFTFNSNLEDAINSIIRVGNKN